MTSRKLILLLAISALFLTNLGFTAIPFEQYFYDKTMRIDYYHTGTKVEEVISLDKVYEEPAVLTHGRQMWAGSRNNLLDTLNLGKYLAKVVDVKTNKLIFSRGFSSIYGEWETTDEAEKRIYRSFHESVLMPFPKQKIQFVIAKRDRENYFQPIFSTVIDPNSRFVNRDKRVESYHVDHVFKSGDPHEKVDVVILGDGYSKSDMKQFRKDAQHYTEVLFDVEPFKTRKNDFNVWYVESLSLESGIDQPRKNEWRANLLECSYNSFDSPRYVLTYANKIVRDIASLVPYDQIYIIVNSDRYGGGGIFNLYSTCYSTDEGENSDWWPDYVFVHEFGHAFAGLGDEYYSSSVAYNEFYPPGVDPWEPNVGVVQNGHIKWEHLMDDNTPTPTPWDKAKYDSLGMALGKLDRSANNYQEQYQNIEKQRDQLLLDQKYWNKVGAFEGSGYASEGLYRPFLDCRMFSKSLVDFCPVCHNAIEKMIDFHTR